MSKYGDIRRCNVMQCEPYENGGGMKVFWGILLTNGAPSKMEATAKTIKGNTSEWEVRMRQG